MSEQVTEVTTRETVVGGVMTSLKRLDPNMLAVLLLVLVLNGLFFYAYSQNLQIKHIEFLEAMKSCNVAALPANLRLAPPAFPGGIDR